MFKSNLPVQNYNLDVSKGTPLEVNFEQFRYLCYQLLKIKKPFLSTFFQKNFNKI